MIISSKIANKIKSIEKLDCLIAEIDCLLLLMWRTWWRRRCSLIDVLIVEKKSKILFYFSQITLLFLPLSSLFLFVFLYFSNSLPFSLFLFFSDFFSFSLTSLFLSTATTGFYRLKKLILPQIPLEIRFKTPKITQTRIWIILIIGCWSNGPKIT